MSTPRLALSLVFSALALLAGAILWFGGEPPPGTGPERDLGATLLEDDMGPVLPAGLESIRTEMEPLATPVEAGEAMDRSSAAASSTMVRAETPVEAEEKEVDEAPRKSRTTKEEEPGGWILEGRVYPVRGAEAEGTSVKVQLNGRSLGGMHLDLNGQFAIPIPPSTMTSMDRITLIADHPDYARTRLEERATSLLPKLSKKRSGARHVTISMVMKRPSSVIQGFLRSKKGVEVEAALFRVDSQGWPERTPTDDLKILEGRFSLRIPDPGTYHAVFWAKDHSVVSHTIDARQPRNQFLQPIELVSEVGLTGRVLGPRGYSLRGREMGALPVFAKSRQLFWHELLTDGEIFVPTDVRGTTQPDGSFEIRGLAPLPSELFAEELTGLAVPERAMVERVEPTPYPFDVRLPVTRLDFGVHDEHGPVEGARVRVMMKDEVQQTRTNKEGQAHLFVSSETSGEMLVESPGHHAFAMSLSSHRPADNVGRSIELVALEEGDGCELELVGAEGELPDALGVGVYIPGARLGRQYRVNSVDGVALLRHLPTGKVRVVVSDADPTSFALALPVPLTLHKGQRAKLEITFVQGGRLRFVPQGGGSLKTPSGARLAVFVESPVPLYPVDKSGRPSREIPGVPGGQSRQRIPLFQGQAWESFPNLPPGSHPIEIEFPGSAALPGTVEIRPGKVTEVPLDVEAWTRFQRGEGLWSSKNLAGRTPR